MTEVSFNMMLSYQLERYRIQGTVATAIHYRFKV